MYSFAPIADTSDVHTGFYFIAIVCAIFALVALFNASKGEFLTVAVICGLVTAMAHNSSYTPVHPLNQQVIGTFVAFQHEGYSESSGKTRSDHHYMYVVYNVDGVPVILQANEGAPYPPKAVLYKN